MTFDIAVQAKEIALEDEGKVVHILDANGDPAFYGGTEVEQSDGSKVIENAQPVTWTICGINSKQWRKAEAWQRKAMRVFHGREQTDAEHQEHQAEFVARCSLGNAGFGENGQPLPFTTANATKILVTLPYIRRQLEGVMGNHAGFTKRPSAG